MLMDGNKAMRKVKGLTAFYSKFHNTSFERKTNRNNILIASHMFGEVSRKKLCRCSRSFLFLTLNLNS